MFRLIFSCLLLILASCSTTKHITTEIRAIETTTTTLIDTTVKLTIDPIKFIANADTLKTLYHFVHSNEMVQDTLINHGDTLIINRNGSKIGFVLKSKPRDVKVQAKKFEYKKQVVKSVKKDIKRTNYIPLLLIIVGVIAIVFFIRRFVK